MRKNHILVVDDNDSVREITRIMLNYLDYQVTEAHNGIEGVKLFKNHPDTLDLILTDYQMPGMNGDEMVQEIHRIDQDVPIIMGTGSSDLSETVIEQWGIQALFFKPFCYEDLSQQMKLLI